MYMMGRAVSSREPHAAVCSYSCPSGLLYKLCSMCYKISAPKAIRFVCTRAGLQAIGMGAGQGGVCCGKVTRSIVH
jgi:hypothetical protein